jgi:flagellar basal body-associated protein FliL
MVDEKKQVAHESKTWIEIILMPLVIALVGVLGTHWITKEQEVSALAASKAQIESAKEAAKADRQIKLLEIFSEKIASDRPD